METQPDTPQPEAPPSAYDACAPKERAWVDELFLCGLNHTEASRRMGYAAPEKHGWRMSKNVRVRAAIEERLKAAGAGADEVAYVLSEHLRGTAADWLTIERVQRCQKVWVPVGVALEKARAEADVERETLRRLQLSGKEREAADDELAKLEARVVRLEVWLEREPSRMIEVDGPVEEVVTPRIDLDRLRAAGKLHLVKKLKQDTDGGLTVELYDAQGAAEKLMRALGMTGPKGTAEDPIVTETRVTAISFVTPDAGQAGDPDAQ